MARINRFILLVCLVIIVSYSNVWSQFVINVRATGTTAASFLEIGVGARAMGMGGTYAAIANDPTALYYNPAGIAWINGPQMEIMHNEWLVGTKHDFFGAVLPLRLFNSALGLSVNTLGYGDQPVRTVRRPEGTGENYNARDVAVAISYAMALTDRFSFGLSTKWINQRIWHESGNAAALDIGIFYETVLRGLRLGFCMTNFGTNLRLTGRDMDSTVDPDKKNSDIDRVPVRYKTDSYPLPMTFRAGISYEKDLGMLGSLLISADLLHPTDNQESINLGAEYGFAGMFYVRGGYENLFEENSINGLTLGCGIDYYHLGRMGFHIDYAYSNWSILDNSQRFSMGISFP